MENEEMQQRFEDFDELYKTRRFAELKNLMLKTEPQDVAKFMEDNLSDADLLFFFRLLPKDMATDVFVEIPTDMQEELIRMFTDKELKEVIDDMFMDDTVDIIEEMPSGVVKRILKNASPTDRATINELLEYPDDSAGTLMTTEYVALRSYMTVDDAFDKIRSTGVNKETIYTCYVTDEKRKLLGIVSVKDLLLANRNEKLETIMESDIITVNTLTDKEEVGLIFSKYDLLALPVVDKEGCIVGIITIDDAVDVIQEEATEDIQKMAAMLPTTDRPYLQTSVFKIYLSRLPWLLILMVSATLTSLILGSFENKLMVYAALYACVPMLMDTGGNAGSQASVTVIRSLALGEVEFKDIFRVIWKELRTALLLGLSVALVCFGKLLLIDKLYNPDMNVWYALVISLSLFITIIIAKLVGATLPLLVKKCKLDPAVVASPFITTIVDAVSLLVYCGIAFSILPAVL